MNKLIPCLIEAGRTDLAKKVNKVLSKEIKPRGDKVLQVIKDLQNIMPDGWSLNEATSYWTKLPGKVMSKKIQKCLKNPPKGVKNPNNFCNALGTSMQWLGITIV